MTTQLMELPVQRHGIGRLKQWASSIYKTALEVVTAIQLLSADEGLMREIATSLAHRPGSWTWVHRESSWYEHMIEDVRDVCPSVGPNCLILMHLTRRWVLIADRDHVYPFVFKNRGNFTAVHKIIVDKQITWLSTYLDLMAGIVREGKYIGDKPQLEDCASEVLTSLGAIASSRKPGFDIPPITF